jgi:hypothetical protein
MESNKMIEITVESRLIRNVRVTQKFVLSEHPAESDKNQHIRRIQHNFGSKFNVTKLEATLTSASGLPISSLEGFYGISEKDADHCFAVLDSDRFESCKDAELTLTGYGTVEIKDLLYSAKSQALKFALGDEKIPATCNTCMYHLLDHAEEKQFCRISNQAELLAEDLDDCDSVCATGEWLTRARLDFLALQAELTGTTILRAVSQTE